MKKSEDKAALLRKEISKGHANEKAAARRAYLCECRLKNRSRALRDSRGKVAELKKVKTIKGLLRLPQRKWKAKVTPRAMAHRRKAHRETLQMLVKHVDDAFKINVEDYGEIEINRFDSKDGRPHVVLKKGSPLSTKTKKAMIVVV